jgi:diguanylate cyclase (GGDEF)-like protein/PAS domain S-box-containing protein
MTYASHVLSPELRAMLEASPDAVLIVDRKGTIIAVNGRVEHLFAARAEQLQGRPVEVLLPGRARRAHAATRKGYAAFPTVRAMSQRSGLTALRSDGSEFSVEVALTPIVGSADGLVMAVVHDVTARLPMAAALASPDHARNALDVVPDAILTTDGSGRIEYLNRAAEELTGCKLSVARGRDLDEVLPLVSESTGDRVPSPIAPCLHEDVSSSSEFATAAEPGRARRVLDLSAMPIRDRAGAVTGAAVVARDVTHTRQIVQQLTHQATHDPLTGLVNRSEFERRLANALASTGGQAHHAVCYLDLDGFKQVNDACGHAVGDELLRQLSEVMRERMRSRDTLARLGGDEFGLLLEHCEQPQAERIAEDIRKAIGGYRFTAGEHTYAVGASIGVVPLRPGMRPADVIRAADAACYRAKRIGGDRVEVSRGGETVEAHHRPAWSRRVLHAVEGQRFQLYAQPILRLRDAGASASCLELLLRVGGSHGGLPLRAFLPTVRRYGLLPTVDEWVVREAVRRLGEWQDTHSGLDRPTVAINLGEDTVASGMVPALVSRELAATGLPPETLCFEISELTVAVHPSASADLISRLRAAGCRTTLEHCGSSMLAFTMLRRLKPDYLKIAGHIVRSVHRDPVQRALAGALNEVGHALGLGTIAMQVERPGDLEEIRRLGVDYAQGFAVGRPQPCIRT